MPPDFPAIAGDLPHQLRQLGDVGGDAPGLVVGEEVCVDPLELVANLKRIVKSLQGEIRSVARSPLRVVCLNLRFQSKGWAATLDEDQKVGRELHHFEGIQDENSLDYCRANSSRASIVRCKSSVLHCRGRLSGMT